MLDKRQIIAQYVDDISFILKAFQKCMIWLTQLFDLFSIAHGFQINHVKYIVFWIGGKKESRPT
jgi:hypothetical protein